MATEVSFELPLARFTSFLVVEPKAFPFIFRWHLPSVVRLLVASAGDMVESGSMMVQKRKKRKRLPKRGQRDGRRIVVTEEKRCKRLLKKHFRGEGGRFGKSQQKLS
jgi:hypothetical protein